MYGAYMRTTRAVSGESICERWSVRRGESDWQDKLNKCVNKSIHSLKLYHVQFISTGECASRGAWRSSPCNWGWRRPCGWEKKSQHPQAPHLYCPSFQINLFFVDDMAGSTIVEVWGRFEGSEQFLLLGGSASYILVVFGKLEVVRSSCLKISSHTGSFPGMPSPIQPTTLTVASESQYSVTSLEGYSI
jgi:hypothetical protein